MSIIETLKELSAIFGLSIFHILACLAATMFLAFGSLLSLVVGTRRMFVFGVLPVLVGAALGVFPVYFTFVCLVVALCIAFISLPKRLSYIDRIREIEMEMYMEKSKRVR